MSDYNSLAIIIMLLAIVIAITSLSIRLDNKDCKDCPNIFERASNSTSIIIVDIDNKRDCINEYPFGYYHTIINGKCRMLIWTSDLDKDVRSLNNTYD